MIPTPKLDDRSFKDLVDEAIRLIPQYCPDWTNYNASDPGITLIELFAWMMEMSLYRLNCVPDKNYLTFLNLLGIRLRPPQPAAVVLTFKMSDKGDHAQVPRGTTVATMPSADGKTVSFETDSPLLVVHNRIAKCFSQYGKSFTEHTLQLDNPTPEGFDPFAGTSVAERYLYLGGDELEALIEGSSLRVRLRCPHPNVADLLDLLDWEIFDGLGWRVVVPIDVESDADTVVLPAPRVIGKTTVNDVESFYVRARLVDVPASPEITQIDTIFGAIKITGEGLLPEQFLVHSSEDIFSNQDPGRRFEPFGKEPKKESECYIRVDQAFGHKGALVRLDFPLEGGETSKPNASPDLVLKWEYFNATSKRWRVLATCHHGDGKIESPEETRFSDGTACFTKPGIVSFVVPDDLSPVDVNGTEGLFIRCRIEAGDYGMPGTYELDGDKWVFKDTRPLRPPVIREMSVRFEEKEHFFPHVFAENDGVFSDFSEQAQVEFKPFTALSAVAEASPTLYLGLDDSFPNEEIQLYFHMIEESPLRDPLTVADQRTGTSVVVSWEYFNGKAWQNLFPQDETQGFLHSGFLRFVGPTDFRRSKRFGESLFFLRARLDMGGFVEAPRIQRILLNSVYAHNVMTFGESVLGSSQGTPRQVFKLPKGEILSGQKVVVLEREKPKEPEQLQIVEDEGEDAIWADPDGKGWWVRYHEVEDLYESMPDARHYVKDIVTREVLFGDGIHGFTPPKGDRNIRLARYQIGGGLDGNVPTGSLTVLKQALTFIESVTNPIPAGGGSDMESVDEIKARAPHLFRSRFRAVTAEDFEWIARQASTSVARAKCIPCKDREGEVTVIIVPKVADDISREGDAVKPLPSTELIRRVKADLDAHKLISTIVHVVRPRYRNIAVSVTLIRQPVGSSEAIKTETVKRVNEFLHPLRGGKNRRGWPFGRSLTKLDVYHVCEQIGGVDFIEKVSLRDVDTGEDLDTLRLAEEELPFVQSVEVIERSQERIL